MRARAFGAWWFIDVSGWFETDVGPHFIDCLSQCENQIASLEKCSRNWPWVFVALASFLQAACVLYLDERDSMGVDALSDKDRKRKIASLQHDYTGEPIGNLKLANPKTLLSRVRKQSRIPILDKKKHRLARVFSLRNEFMHFTPKGFSLELSGAVDLCEISFQSVIEIISDKGMYGSTRLEDASRRASIERCRSLLKKTSSLTSSIE